MDEEEEALPSFIIRGDVPQELAIRAGGKIKNPRFSHLYLKETMKQEMGEMDPSMAEYYVRPC